MSISKQVIQKHKSLYDLYCEIQESSEAIKGLYFKISKTPEEARKEKERKKTITDLIEKIDAVKNDINDVEKKLFDEKKALCEKKIDDDPGCIENLIRACSH
jgi:uncharacterized coiled-coil DUF342 family protein